MKKSGKASKRTRTLSLAQALNKAQAKIEAGQLASAHDILLALVKREPGHADAWHSLGAVSYLMGDFTAGGNAFEEAVKLAPANPDYLNDLASLYFAQGNYEQARPLYDRVTAIAPQFVEAAYNLATCHLEQRHYELAIPILKNICEKSPTMLPAAFNLGVAFRHLGKIDDAINCLTRALPLAAENPQVRIELARCYFAMKDYARAREHFLKLSEREIDVALAAEIAQASYLDGATTEAVNYLKRMIARVPAEADQLRLLLADIYVNQGAQELAEELLCRLIEKPNSEEFPPASNLAVRIGLAEKYQLWASMEARLTDPAVSIEHTLKLHFGLGQAYDDSGEYDKAQAHYRKGNDLKSASTHYDKHVIEATVSNLAQHFSTGLTQAPGDRHSEANRAVFVLGMPRSGTSLIAQILGAHKDVHNAGELGYFSKASIALKTMFGFELDYPLCISSLKSEHAQKLRESYAYLLDKHNSNSVYVVDKFPENFLHIGLIKHLFPEALIFHVQRDPRDVALSIYFQNFAHGNRYSWRLEDIAHYYAQYERAMRIWQKINVPKLIDIRYNDIVKDLESVAKRMVAAMSLPWDENCLAFHRAESDVRTASHWQVRQPIYHHAIERWQNYPELTDVFMQELSVQRDRFQLPVA